MIYECFYFWDELDLLDVKLHELDGLVDKFVVLEFPTSLTHKPQPLLYEENKERFAPFHDKIIHIVGADDAPKLVGYPLYLHRYKYMTPALGGCQPDDFIIVDDPDVILKKSTLEQIKAENHETHNVGFVNDWYFYYMDVLCTRLKYTFGWGSPFKHVDFSNGAPRVKNRPIQYIENAGYHFGKLGGVDKIIQNIKGYPHRECDVPYLTDRGVMLEKMEKGYGWDSVPGGPHFQEVVMKDVPFIPENYPQYIVEHPEIYAQYFKGGMG